MHEPKLAAEIRGRLLAGEILPANMGERDRWDRTGLHRIGFHGYRLDTEAPLYDGLFLRVIERPEGFKLAPMQPGGLRWFWLLDPLGRRRGTVFYFEGQFGVGRDKGARSPSAHLALLSRFRLIRRLGVDQWTLGIDVTDGGEVVRQFGAHPDVRDRQFATTGEYVTAQRQRRDAVQRDHDEALAWLAARAPDHEDPLAYWGEHERTILGLEDEAA